MNPPSVLLDHSFLVAVEHADDEHHDDAVVRYGELIDDFIDQRCLLVARADHLATTANRDLFAPVDKLHVARQHRNAAAELVARTGLPMEDAITLVLLHRNRIRNVVSYGERLADYDLDMKVPLPTNSVGAESADNSGAPDLATDAS
jgi:predicted nucleic acid-binding protein